LTSTIPIDDGRVGLPRILRLLEKHNVLLDKLITYIKSHKRVWFATHEQIARHVQSPA
jgi:peptidoglycan/xylan/chitin deacetylase (PgdA/CDA1 family)